MRTIDPAAVAAPIAKMATKSRSPADARGGSVDVDARPGGGTTITDTVPDGAPALR